MMGQISSTQAIPEMKRKNTIIIVITTADMMEKVGSIFVVEQMNKSGPSPYMVEMIAYSGELDSHWSEVVL